MKNPKAVYLAIAIMSLLCFTFSIVIEVQKLNNDKAINNICSAISPGSQCNVVQNSKYGKIFGLDNSFYGIAGFALMLILSILQWRHDVHIRRVLIFVGSLIAGILAIWFLYLQKFIIKAYCIFCVFVDILSLVMLVLSIFLALYYIKKR